MSGLLKSPEPPATQAQPAPAPTSPPPPAERAPDWRVPVVIVAIVVGLALTGYFIAVGNISPSKITPPTRPAARLSHTR